MKKALKDVVGKLFFPPGSKRTILRGVCAGLKIRVTPDSRPLLLGYEKKHQFFLARKVRPGMTVYDIGGNVGQYVLFFSKLGANVFTFEPNPAAFAQLTENAALNGFSKVDARQVALGDEDRECELLIPNASAMSKLSDVEKTHVLSDPRAVRVQMRRLDSLLGQLPPPDLIKLDVEGAGAVVLKGAQQTLKRYLPDIYMELHGPDEQRAAHGLMSIGYRLEDLDGREITDIATVWHTPIWAHAKR